MIIINSSHSCRGGGSWTPVNNGLTSKWVNILAIHPTTLYVGIEGGGAFAIPFIKNIYLPLIIK